MLSYIQIKILSQKTFLMSDNDSNKKHNLVGYLLQENKSLKDQVNDLKQMVRINKIEINVLSQTASSSNKYIEIITNYRTANQNNQKKIEIIEQKLDEATSEKLVLEQLHSESITELKAFQELHKDRIESLQSIITELEKKVMTMEKFQRNYDTITGFVERNKDIFNPTDQAIVFKRREDQMNDQVHLLQLDVHKHKENEDNLLKINGILRHKVVTLQAKLAMPNKNLGQILDKSLKRLMMYFIQTQKRLLTGDQSDSDGEQDLQLIAPELSTYFGQQKMRRQKDYNVPHLDLLKIRGSVATGNAKIKQQLLKRNHLTKQQKIQRLQIQLEYTRRQLTKNMIDLRQQISRRRCLQKICEQLESRNQLLVDSNDKLSQRLDKLNKKIKDHKEKQQIKFVQLDETLINDTTLLKIDNNTLDKQKHKTKFQAIKVMLTQSLDQYDSKEEYKVHWELLARDLQRNEKIKNLRSMKKKKEEVSEQEWKPKLKKSTSNPFLYFNERREEIMQVGTGLNHHENRLEQTEIFNMRMDQGENLDDIFV